MGSVETPGLCQIAKRHTHDMSMGYIQAMPQRLLTSLVAIRISESETPPTSRHKLIKIRREASPRAEEPWPHRPTLRREDSRNQMLLAAVFRADLEALSSTIVYGETYAPAARDASPPTNWHSLSAFGLSGCG